MPSAALLDLLRSLVDDLGLASCRLIKVDVEGFEAQVLRGAAATIARHRHARPARRGQHDAQALLWIGF